MKRRITLTVALALVGCLSQVSFASSKKPAVYSATEDTPSEEVISSAPGYTGQVISNTPAPVQVQTMAPAPKMAAPAHVQAKAQPASDAAQYDSVPNNQTEPLLRRLHLVEELVSKYGRAYNYRELTVPQLQDILAQLDNQASENSKLHERMNAREELKKELQSEPQTQAQTGAIDRMEDIPAPEPELNNSIGSSAPEAYAPIQGARTGADPLPPVQN